MGANSNFDELICSYLLPPSPLTQESSSVPKNRLTYSTSDNQSLMDLEEAYRKLTLLQKGACELVGLGESILV